MNPKKLGAPSLFQEFSSEDNGDRQIKENS